MKTITYHYTYGQIEFECELEYDPGEPPEAYLISAKTGGVDVLPIMSVDLVAQIEEAAAWSQA